MEAQSVDVQKLQFSNFNSSHPTKLIIHGYNSDKDLDVLVDMRKGESLSTGNQSIVVCTEPMLEVKNSYSNPRKELHPLCSVQTGFRIFPSSYPVGEGVLFTGEKMPDIQADHSNL
jgi:hypothetical protein